MQTYTKNWFDHNIPHLTKLLAPYAEQPGVRMLEIGAYEGRSTVWFVSQILTGEGSFIVTVDTWKGSAEHDPKLMSQVYSQFQGNIEPYGERVRPVVSSSQQFLASALVSGPELFDVVYIDGSHRASDVLSDAVMSFPLLKAGGLLIFDDFKWPHGSCPEDRPEIAITSFLHCYRGQYNEVYRGYQLAIEKLT